MSAALQRSTFRTSRLLDFASEKELVAQTGHRREEWPLVLLKELVDNALDAGEETGIAPEITITVDSSGVAVADNGPGIPAETVKGVLDFAVRVSSREAYVSTRGAQGNALKTLVAMPFVLDGERGRVEVEAHCTRHVVEFRVDRIRQEPLIDLTTEPSVVKNGTIVRVLWPHSACSILTAARQRFLQVTEDYAWFNPHASISVDWFGQPITAKATDAAWAKWKPSDPTSPQWYTAAHLERLLAGYVAIDADLGRDRTVREVVAEFRGLSGSAKQKAVLEATGLSRAPLSELVTGNGIDRVAVERLLEAMKANSKPVKPEMLGIIGKEHFRARFEAAGCEMETFDYRRVAQVDDEVPWVLEAAFGWCPDAGSRRLVTGVNWSPGILNPFRQLGLFGMSLDTVLAKQHAGGDEPVILALHLTCPRVEYTDRGKSAVVTDHSKSSAIIKAVEGVTQKWAKQRKREERERSAVLNRRQALISRRAVSIKQAAWAVMEDAYLKASAGGRLPANARQIMYAARPYIQRTADRDLTGKFDQYFTQTLLPDYMEETGADWNVVFDARGRFAEPHTCNEVPLGTLQVRNYLNRVRAHEVSDLDFAVWEPRYPTIGPKNRYGAILYIEKEGFTPLFAEARLAERYDLAIMSNKGMSVTASRELVQALCVEHEVPLFVLHDFDISGFSIFGTLRSSTRRFRYSSRFKVVDLGLRLGDIDSLDDEKVFVASPEKTKATLRRHGATEAEIAFLLQRRVELNAFASDELIAWIEGKLDEHGVRKVMPDDDTLADAYRRMRHQARVQETVDRMVAEMDDTVIAVPESLRRQVEAEQQAGPERSWDAVLRGIAEDDHRAGRS